MAAGSDRRGPREVVMAFIEVVGDDAGGEPGEVLAAERERTGSVPNHARVFAHRPDVYRAWRDLVTAVVRPMGVRRYELATLAAARALRSSYCALAHGSVVADRILDAETVRQVAVDHRAAGLDPIDVATMDLAEKVALDAPGMTQQDIDRLRALGLSDVEVLDIVLAAAARCFFSTVLDALAVLPDAAYRDLDPSLRAVLVVGRPIAES